MVVSSAATATSLAQIIPSPTPRRSKTYKHIRHHLHLTPSHTVNFVLLPKANNIKQENHDEIPKYRCCDLCSSCALPRNLALAKDLSDELSSSNVVTVNINEADAAAIANTLVGVGLSRAQAIVGYRTQYGRFYSPEELTAVKGIGQSTVERNLSRITTE